MVNDGAIFKRERRLRDWFIRGSDPIQAVVDGLDIGWGGVQSWATAQISLPSQTRHLDFACGYGTFLAELGWRFPDLQLFGLNIDFAGPHGLARPLLAEAGVKVRLVQADARQMPFASGTFDSVSCFLGLQDVEIGFGPKGVKATCLEAVRVLRPQGTLVLLDKYPFPWFEALLDGLPVVVTARKERPLNVRWNRKIAKRAISLYAAGWVAQARSTDRKAQEQLRRKVLSRMTAELESQLATQGYWVPFGPVRMLLARKVGKG